MNISEKTKSNTGMIPIKRNAFSEETKKFTKKEKKNLSIVKNMTCEFSI